MTWVPNCITRSHGGQVLSLKKLTSSSQHLGFASGLCREHTAWWLPSKAKDNSGKSCFKKWKLKGNLKYLLIQDSVLDAESEAWREDDPWPNEVTTGRDRLQFKSLSSQAWMLSTSQSFLFYYHEHSPTRRPWDKEDYWISSLGCSYSSTNNYNILKA